MRSKKPEADTRPRIWAEGSQNPPFQPRAFALASVLYARESLSSLLDRCAASAQDFRFQVASGRWRVPPENLGRTGRYLPGYQSVATAIGAASQVLARAARVVTPAEEAPVQDASIFAAQPDPLARVVAPLHPVSRKAGMEPAAMTAPVPAPAELPEEDRELAAIRALLAQESPARLPRASLAAPSASPASVAPAPAPADTGPGWRSEWLANATATALGYGLLVVSVPVGAVLAGLAHLNGEDLRKRVTES